MFTVFLGLLVSNAVGQALLKPTWSHSSEGKVGGPFHLELEQGRAAKGIVDTVYMQHGWRVTYEEKWQVEDADTELVDGRLTPRTETFASTYRAPEAWIDDPPQQAVVLNALLSALASQGGVGPYSATASALGVHVVPTSGSPLDSLVKLDPGPVPLGSAVEALLRDLTRQHGVEFRLYDPTELLAGSLVEVAATPLSARDHLVSWAVAAEVGMAWSLLREHRAVPGIWVLNLLPRCHRLRHWRCASPELRDGIRAYETWLEEWMKSPAELTMRWNGVGEPPPLDAWPVAPARQPTVVTLEDADGTVLGTHLIGTQD